MTTSCCPDTQCPTSTARSRTDTPFSVEAGRAAADPRSGAGGGTPTGGPGCRIQLRQILVRLPAAYSACESLMAGYRSALQPRVSGSRARQGITLSDDLVHVRSDVLRVLSAWSGLVSDERSVPPPAQRRAPDLCRHLIHHLDWLLAHPAAAEFADEITTLNRAVHAALNRSRQPKVDLTVFRCARCEEPLEYRQGDVEVTSAASEIRCRSGHTWRPDQWLQLARGAR